MPERGVYILQSLKNGKYYIGSTEDVAVRLAQHNKGYAAATKLLRPLQLKVFLPCPTITVAKQLELRLKRYKSRKILEKVIKDATFPWDYQNEGE